VASYGAMFDLFTPLVKPLFPVLDAVFGVFLTQFGPDLGSQLALGAMSILMAAIVSLVYALLIDKERFNEIREKQSAYQDKIKEARDEGEMEKANKLLQENMGMQKEFMKVSMKPIIGSMLLFFLMIPWVLNTFVPVQQFSPMADTTGLNQTVEGAWSGELSYYNGQYRLGEAQIHNHTDGSVTLVHDGETYFGGDKITLDGLRFQIGAIDLPADEGGDAEVKLSHVFLPLPVGLPLAGDSFEWLGFYIIFQIPFTFLFRKMLGVQ